ncbi:hypothetical protein FVEN_g13117 [Fusarium venenatum]|nr:hypothetical protein FVEN_g13117 [Fusarium venenatum]
MEVRVQALSLSFLFARASFVIPAVPGFLPVRIALFQSSLPVSVEYARISALRRFHAGISSSIVRGRPNNSY